MIRVIVWFLIFVSTWNKICAIDIGPNCSYNTDMSQVDPETCIRIMRELGMSGKPGSNIAGECFGLYGGPGKLRDGRGDVRFFSISIGDNYQEDYPENFTYTILRRIGDWTEENSLTRIAGCESLGEKDSCTLPQKKENERQYAYFPVVKQPGEWFCEYELIESVREVERSVWCEVRDDLGCVKLIDGKLSILTVMVPLSLGQLYSTNDYCVFSMDKNDLDSNSKDVFVALDISLNNANDTLSANVSGRSLSCSVRENLTTNGDSLKDILEEYRGPEDEFVCFFLKLESWLPQPLCQKIDPPVSRDYPVVPIVIVVVASVVVLAVIVGLTWLYKTQLKKCTFKRHMEELPHPLAAHTNGVLRNDEWKDNGKGSEEVVDEITFSPSQEKHLEHNSRKVIDAPDLNKIDTDASKAEDTNIGKVPEATPLCGGDDSGFNEEQSKNESKAESDLSNTPPPLGSGDSGLESLRSNSALNQAEVLMQDDHTAKHSLERSGGKITFPAYLKKNFIEQDSSVKKEGFPVVGYTAKDQIA